MFSSIGLCTNCACRKFGLRGPFLNQSRHMVYYSCADLVVETAFFLFTIFVCFNSFFQRKIQQLEIVQMIINVSYQCHTKKSLILYNHIIKAYDRLLSSHAINLKWLIDISLFTRLHFQNSGVRIDLDSGSLQEGWLISDSFLGHSDLGIEKRGFRLNSASVWPISGL